MRVLFLTQIVPWPLDAGPKIKTWNVLKYLHEKGNEIILATFVRDNEVQYVDELSKVCSEVHCIPIKRSKISDLRFWIRSQFHHRPFLIERDDIPEMRSLVNSLVMKREIDILHADQINMLQFACSQKGRSDSSPEHFQKKPPYIIFDAHNAVWKIVERMGIDANWLLKLPAMQEADRMRRYEEWGVSFADQTLAVSEVDKQALQITCGVSGLSNSKITVIPIAVDTQILKPAFRNQENKNILVIGSMNYPPNADGILWFAKEVFPIILASEPNAVLTIVGKKPPLELQNIAAVRKNSIILTGYVPELTPYFENSAVEVVPVRAGGGMRVRILEGFAKGMPMVTTTVGLEGIEAEHGIHLLVEDQPEKFAESVIKLMNDSQLQDTLSKGGRKFVEDNYDWAVVLKKLDEVYQQAEKVTP